MKSVATYLKKTPDRTYAIRQRIGSATLSWLRALDEKNKGLILTVSVGIFTGTDGVKCAVIGDIELHSSYTILDGKSLIESLNLLCADLRGCVPRGEEFVSYICKTEGQWSVFVDTGLGGEETVKRFHNQLNNPEHPVTDVFELTTHNLEEVS